MNQSIFVDEVTTVKVNVTEEKGNTVRARYVDPENDISLTITLYVDLHQ
jgi:hypothetical protein